MSIRLWPTSTPKGGTIGSPRQSWASKAPDIKELVKQASVDPGFLASVRGLITPGTTLILTDMLVNVSTRSGPGFGILTTAAVR